MATVARVINRANPPERTRWVTATVTAASGHRLTCDVAPVEEDATAATINGLATSPIPTVGAIVLIAITPAGNFILGTIG